MNRRERRAMARDLANRNGKGPRERDNLRRTYSEMLKDVRAESDERTGEVSFDEEAGVETEQRSSGLTVLRKRLGIGPRVGP